MDLDKKECKLACSNTHSTNNRCYSNSSKIALKFVFVRFMGDISLYLYVKVDKRKKEEKNVRKCVCG